jgi:hypothetical protein
MEDNADIDFIKDQVKRLNTIKNKIYNTGEITLTTDDIDTLDKICQTLTSFKIFLISNSFSKEVNDNSGR